MLSGPLRIKRHDALCNILFQNLLVDNAGTRTEQRCSSESNDRPGDIFHPGSLEGKPGYFDVSVRNSFTFLHVNNCASQAGAAAHAGVIEKDYRHA